MIPAALAIQRAADAKLLVIDVDGAITHRARADFPGLIRDGDIVVANDAATLPASLAGVHAPTGAAIEVRLAGRDSLLPEHVTRFTALVFGAGDFRTPTEHRPHPPELHPGDTLRLGPLCAVVIRVLGHPLAFSFTGLLVGSVIYSLPFAVQPLVVGFTGVDRGYIEAASGLGASPRRVFWGVVLPMTQSSLLTSAVLAFTHTVGEFGVVLMLGGNIPGATRTLSISLYDLVQDGNYAAANRTALLLLAFSMLALMAIYLVPSLRRAGGRQVDVLR